MCCACGNPSPRPGCAQPERRLPLDFGPVAEGIYKILSIGGNCQIEAKLMSTTAEERPFRAALGVSNRAGFLAAVVQECHRAPALMHPGAQRRKSAAHGASHGRDRRKITSPARAKESSAHPLNKTRG